MSLLAMRPEPMTEKKAIIGVHISLLAGLLKLPPQIDAVGIYFDPNRDELLVQIAGDGLPDNCMHFPGQTLPTRYISLRSRKAVTMDERPEEVDYIEFDRFS